MKNNKVMLMGILVVVLSFLVITSVLVVFKSTYTSVVPTPTVGVTSSPSPFAVKPTNGVCPTGYVYYGVPLGCVLPGYLEKCQHSYGGCPK